MSLQKPRIVLDDRLARILAALSGDLETYHLGKSIQTGQWINGHFCPNCDDETLSIIVNNDGCNSVGVHCKNCTSDQIQEAAGVERRELEPRALLKKKTPKESVAALDTALVLTTECGADIKLRAVTWLWPDRVPLGKLTTIVGDPGVGKTLLALDLVARVTSGREFSDGAPGTEGAVLFVSAEDDPADTLKPRLVAMGADVERVHFFTGATRWDTTAGKDAAAVFTLADVEALENAIEKIGDVVAVIFDPAAAFVGHRVDTHRNAPVRTLLAPVVELAARRKFALIFIDHLNKQSSNAALYRAGGSIAWVAAARAVWLVGCDPEDEGRRLFLRLKGNLARDPGGLAFRLKEKRLRSLGGTPVPSVAWDSKPVLVTAAEALGDPRTGPQTKGEAAVEWLRERLSQGPVAAGEALEDAEAAGFKHDAIFRARKTLGVRSSKDGRKNWVWALPQGNHQMFKSSNHQMLKVNINKKN